MKVFINHSEISFSLEKEQNAFEVITEIAAWATKRQLMLNTIKLNETSYSYPPLGKTLKTIPLEQVKELHLEVLNLSTYSALVCLNAGEALVEMGQTLRETHIQHNIEAISQKLSWIRNALLQSSTLLHLKPQFTPLIVILKTFESELYKIHHGEQLFEQTRIEAIIKSIVTHLKDRFLTLQTQALAHDLKLFTTQETRTAYSQTELTTFLTNIKRETFPLIATMQTWAVKTATAFQQGETALGLTLLTDLTNAISLILSIHHIALPESDTHTAHSQLPEHHPQQKLIQKLETVLKELIAAFQEKDYVEMSDILEYELAPVLKSFTEIPHAIV